MTSEDYEIEVGKSIITAGNSCFTGAIVSLTVTLAGSSQKDPNHYLFIFSIFAMIVFLGIYLRKRGLRILQNLI
jgi:hypothetical protein